jgi:GNAT superfamily N-acetyltransferase
MAEIDHYTPADRRAVDQMYRRVFGPDAADANRLRWDWQYLRNPNNAGGSPEIWIAREGATLVGQYATMPVRLLVAGREVCASWGMDVMVAPERQRQGLGEVLFRTWDEHVGASLGLGLSESSYRLFKKLSWPDVGPVPCLVKPLTRRALRRPSWPMPINRFVSALTLPVVRLVARTRPVKGEIEPTRRFDDRFTALWQSIAPKFDLAVRRDAAYLNWKYAEPPHVRYNIVALRGGAPRGGIGASAAETARMPRGYAVYRHLQEPRGRVTLLVDFLTDPDDHEAFQSLLRFVDLEAREADSDKIRAFAMHAGFRKAMKKAGYFQVKSTMEFVAKINAAPVAASFYGNKDRWHVTLGDSDQDR